MFTGLIQSTGTVNRRAEALVVKGCEPFSPLTLGESVAVDGVCLTVSGLVKGGFLADVSEETLRRTTLGFKALQGGVVNLEPALCLSDRLGGHLVSGHVDGLGEVISITNSNNSWFLELCWKDPAYDKFVCEKASITVDGISLTVAGFAENGRTFSIAVIPHTWSNTSLRFLEVGSLVNLEADLIAKYVESLISGKDKKSGSVPNGISSDWLANHGWN